MASAAVPPPDFRYVEFRVAPAARVEHLRAVAAVVVVLALGSWLALGAEAGPLFACVVAGVVGLGLLQRWAPLVESADVQGMAILPWGVVVHSRREPRVLRWGAIHGVRVHYIHGMDGGTPLVHWSVVTIETRDGVLEGRAPGCVTLDRLEAHLPSYSEEGGRPVALDVDGTPSSASDMDPLFPRLLGGVRKLLRAPARVPELSLSMPGYRSAARPEIGVVGRQVLERWLSGIDQPSGADRRPLACVLAAELGAHQLLDQVLRLLSSPHPFVAAVARAAALRLGADIRRVGTLEELADFVEPSELSPLEIWSEQRVAGTGLV